MTSLAGVGICPKRLSVLVVEDDELLKKLFLLALGHGHLVSLVPNVKDGWARYLENQPNIVFLDIRLPDGNGNDLARQIKEHNPSTYIVMSTASRQIQDKVEAVRNRVDGFISKPFSKKDITDQIDRYLANV